MSKYIGTHLTPEEHHRFGMRAAELGISKSALLRQLAANALAGVTTRRTSAATESAARRTTPRKRKEAA
jgi:hypothetical protein